MSYPIIYCTKTIIVSDIKKVYENFDIKIWQPTLLNFYPPGKSFKYIIYWFFHILRIFSNRNYCSILLYEKEVLVSSLLIVPKYMKWPFMEKNDLQITYVITNELYRGLGIASLMLSSIPMFFNDFNGNWWYVTSNENLVSQKLASKMGFRVIGNGFRVNNLFRSIKLELS
jgi:hypothetical protein